MKRESTALRLTLVLSLLLLLFSGCSLFRPRVITLCTNRPEMAAYVEHFNTLSDDYRVILRAMKKFAEQREGNSGKLNGAANVAAFDGQQPSRRCRGHLACASP